MDRALNLENLQHTLQHEYSVSEISRCLKSLVEDSFGNVRVRGEISGFKYAPSGHAYFNLKDEMAVLRAICWKGLASALNFKLEDGLEVIVSGKISTYEGQSTYQIIIQKIELAGMGALLAMLEKRKTQLASEGLFDAARKRLIPFLPKIIGVVTSPTGAVIRDIMHRISDRMGLHVLVWPVLVQGPLAAGQIAAAIEGFNNMEGGIGRPDVLIVARGGGSVEDLWAFNEEIVVRAAAGSKIPLISAVGHETDTTLIDLAADKRAPTPTAAAEMATPLKAELVSSLDVRGQRLRAALLGSVGVSENRLARASSGLINFSQRLAEQEARLIGVWYRLEQSLSKFASSKAAVFEKVAGKLSGRLVLEGIKVYESKLYGLTNMLVSNAVNLLVANNQKIEGLGRLLESFNYRNVLKRGFALAKRGGGGLITSSEDAKAAGSFALEFSDGSVRVSTGGTKGPKKARVVAGQSGLFD